VITSLSANRRAACDFLRRSTPKFETVSEAGLEHHQRLDTRPIGPGKIPTPFVSRPPNLGSYDFRLNWPDRSIAFDAELQDAAHVIRRRAQSAARGMALTRLKPMLQCVQPDRLRFSRKDWTRFLLSRCARWPRRSAARSKRCESTGWCRSEPAPSDSRRRFAPPRRPRAHHG